MIPNEKRPLRRLLAQWVYEDRWLLVRLACASMVAILLSLAVPYVSQVVFDSALPNGSPRLLLIAALGAFAIGLHRAAISWLSSLMSVDLGIALERRAKRHVVHALVHTTAEQRKLRNAGWMMTTLAGAGTAAQRFAASWAAVIAQGLAFAGYLASLACHSLAAAALVIILNVSISLVSITLIKFEESHIRRALESTSAEQQYLHTLLGRLASLRGLFATERLASRWSAQVRQTADAELASGRVGIYMNTLESIGAGLLSTGLTVWATHQCFARAISLGEMMFLLSSATGLSVALSGVTNGLLGFRGLGPYIGRVDELTVIAAPPVQAAETPLMLDDRIRVDKVSFRYGPDERWILREHDWEVKRGDVIHLRSPSGSGKSTLLRLIAGMLVPSSGTLTVFGLPAHEARTQVLYLPQSCELFETSIRENLELFSGAPRAEIQRVTELTGLSQLLRTLPMGEETRVAAQGQNLSSGQRQLILLTAAFASSRPVLLLDESTGQIDARTRSLCRWDELTKGRTVIRVEHARV